ncbi:MAG: outer membrane beta-barrel protein [Bacteroidota bacterium]
MKITTDKMKTFPTLLAFILCFFFLFSVSLQAQYKKKFRPKQRFHAGIISGLNLAQIDGDNYRGYNKAGFMIGLQGIVLLSPNTELAMELSFSQKGSKGSYTGVLTDQKGRVIRLNYAEVPLLIRFELPNKLVKLEGGFSFARLVQTGITERPKWVEYSYTAIENDFKDHEISWILGGSVKIFQELRLGLRTNVGITNFYTNEGYDEWLANQSALSAAEPYKNLRNYHLTLYVNYQFF